MLEWVGLPQNSIDAIWRESVTLQLLWDIATGAAPLRIKASPMTPESLTERQEREIDLAQELYDLGGDIDMANLFRLHELEKERLVELHAERVYERLMDKDFDALRIYMDEDDDDDHLSR